MPLGVCPGRRLKSGSGGDAPLRRRDTGLHDKNRTDQYEGLYLIQKKSMLKLPMMQYGQVGLAPGMTEGLHRNPQDSTGNRVAFRVNILQHLTSKGPNLGPRPPLPSCGAPLTGKAAYEAGDSSKVSWSSLRLGHPALYHAKLSSSTNV